MLPTRSEHTEDHTYGNSFLLWHSENDKYIGLYFYYEGDIEPTPCLITNFEQIADSLRFKINLSGLIIEDTVSATVAIENDSLKGRSNVGNKSINGKKVSESLNDFENLQVWADYYKNRLHQLISRSRK